MSANNSRLLSATNVARTRHMAQGQVPSMPTSPDFSAFFVLMPARIVDDSQLGSRTRVLAWLIQHGATNRQAVHVQQAQLARELKVGRDTIQRTLRYLTRAGYLEIVIDPFRTGGYSYRLTTREEGDN